MYESKGGKNGILKMFERKLGLLGFFEGFEEEEEEEESSVQTACVTTRA